MRKVLSLILITVLALSIPLAAHAESAPSLDGEWCLIELGEKYDCTVEVGKDGNYQIEVDGEKAVLSQDGDLYDGSSTEQMNLINFENGFLAYSRIESGWYAGEIGGFFVLNDVENGHLLYSFSVKPENLLLRDGKIFPERSGVSEAGECLYSGNKLFFIFGDHYEKSTVLFSEKDAFCCESEVEDNNSEARLFVRAELIE